MNRHLSFLKEYNNNYRLKTYQFFQCLYIYFRCKFNKSKITDIYKIPIILNNRDTLYNLAVLIEYLEELGYTNIIILDNCSTYKPLLDYYGQIKYQVIMLDNNYGAYAIWESGVYKKFYKDYYVYSDSDIMPVEQCPNDFLQHFKNILDDNIFTLKAGFSLKLNDLPESFPYKKEVLYHESKFFDKVNELFYNAPIDTTFALYKPFAKGGWKLKGARTTKPYEARHMPWYFDPNLLADDSIHYIMNATAYTHWTKLMRDFLVSKNNQ